jgi:hypothetical protein
VYDTIAATTTFASIDFTVGQRVLLRYHARRPDQWLSGVICGGPRSKQGHVFYQVKLDNGETRWGAADRFLHES